MGYTQRRFAFMMLFNTLDLAKARANSARSRAGYSQ